MAPRPVPALALLAALPLLLGVRTTSACDNITYISSQVDLLLAEYDRGVGHSAAVAVSAALDVQHASIDERASAVRLLAALYLKWEDKRLSWNVSSWGCDNVLVPSERLWLPDVWVLSAATVGSSGGDTGLRARLSSDGRVSWVVRFDLTAPLTLDLYDWPQDKHEAVFKFGSRSHSTDELDLKLTDLEQSTIFESGMWELLSVQSSESTRQRLGAEQAVVEWRVTLRRRARAHALAVVSVLAGAVLLLTAAALLPPASRPPLCATASLVAALWLISALVRLPGSSSAPRALSLLCAACVCGAGAAAGAALVQRVARCTSPPPHSLRAIVTYASAFCKLIPPEGSSAEWSAWAAAAQLLDYLLLAVMLLTLYIVLFLSF
ncbi:unnamed protein product, partial [Brenthis ino]